MAATLMLCTDSNNLINFFWRYKGFMDAAGSRASRALTRNLTSTFDLVCVDFIFLIFLLFSLFLLLILFISHRYVCCLFFFSMFFVLVYWYSSFVFISSTGACRARWCSRATSRAFIWCKWTPLHTYTQCVSLYDSHIAISYSAIGS